MHWALMLLLWIAGYCTVWTIFSIITIKLLGINNDDDFGKVMAFTLFWPFTLPLILVLYIVILFTGLFK